MPNIKDYRSWRQEKLADPEIAEGYLNDALKDSPAMFRKALLNVMQARQVSVVAKQAGVTRENIYRAFSQGGNPTLDTLNAVLEALGLQLAEVRAKGSLSLAPLEGAPSKKHTYRAHRTSRRKRTLLEGQMALPFGPSQVEAAAAKPSVSELSITAQCTYGVVAWQGHGNLTTGLQYLKANQEYTNQEDVGLPEVRFPVGVSEHIPHAFTELIRQ